MAAKKEIVKVRSPQGVSSVEQNNSNVMRTPRIDKVVLNIGGVGDKIDKGMILLQKLTGKKPVKVATTKRIPTWNVRPGLVVGVKVTLRGEDAENFIKKVLPAINSTIKERQIRPNFVSFGVHEYIEIPGMEYIREVGIMGFEVTVVFLRAGKKVELRKVKRGKMRRQEVTVEEIEKILQDKFKVKILKKIRRTQENTQ